MYMICIWYYVHFVLRAIWYLYINSRGRNVLSIRFRDTNGSCPPPSLSLSLSLSLTPHLVSSSGV